MAGIALRLVVLVAFFLLARSFLIPIVMGGLVAILLAPRCRTLREKMGPRLGRYAPLFLTVSALILVALPLVFVVTQAFLTGSEIVGQGDLVRTFNQASARMMRDVDHLTRPLGIKSLNSKALISDLGPRLTNGAAMFISATAAAIPAYMVDGFLFTVALFYFLRDGERLLRWVRTTSPFSLTETEALFVSVDGTVRGAILGTLVVALVQGGLTLIALIALGVPGAFLWGVLAALCSLMPIVGTMPVTMGATAYFLFDGDPLRAGIMFTAALVIGTSDNIVRPWVQSSSDGMHPLLALLAIFGGLELFGPFGIFLGPVVTAMALWALDTYGALRGDGNGQTRSTLILSSHINRSEVALHIDRHS